MLNCRVITSALIVLTSLGGQPVKADVIQQAQFDANEDVKRAKPIDEEALVNHDEEYIDAYLTEYENAAQAKENNALTGTEEAPEYETIQSSTENSAEQRQLLEEDKKDEQVYQPQQPSAV